MDQLADSPPDWGHYGDRARPPRPAGRFAEHRFSFVLRRLGNLSRCTDPQPQLTFAQVSVAAVSQCTIAVPHGQDIVASPRFGGDAGHNS